MPCLASHPVSRSPRHEPSTTADLGGLSSISRSTTCCLVLKLQLLSLGHAAPEGLNKRNSEQPRKPPQPTSAALQANLIGFPFNPLCLHNRCRLKDCPIIQCSPSGVFHGPLGAPRQRLRPVDGCPGANNNPEKHDLHQSGLPKGEISPCIRRWSTLETILRGGLLWHFASLAASRVLFLPSTSNNSDLSYQIGRWVQVIHPHSNFCNRVKLDTAQA